MHSIWSIPQSQQRKIASSKKLSIEFFFRKFFFTDYRKKAQPINNFQHNYYPYQPTIPIADNTNFQPKLSNNNLYSSDSSAINQPKMNQTVFIENSEYTKRISMKNLGAVLHLFFPLILAILGIPFYIMVVLKLIHFIH
jgi:hypothetical protein